MVPINYLAVLVNVVIALVIGSLWYGLFFKKQYAVVRGMTVEEASTEMKQGGTKKILGNALIALLMSFVLSHTLVFASTYLHTSGVVAGLEAAFWNWIGFVAPAFFGGLLWEKKSWVWFCINAGYYLVTLCVFGLVLALWV